MRSRLLNVQSERCCLAMITCHTQTFTNLRMDIEALFSEKKKKQCKIELTEDIEKRPSYRHVETRSTSTLNK